MKTVSITEQFCSLTQRVKTDVTLNELDKAQFREADMYKGSARLLYFLWIRSHCVKSSRMMKLGVVLDQMDTVETQMYV